MAPAILCRRASDQGSRATSPRNFQSVVARIPVRWGDDVGLKAQREHPATGLLTAPRASALDTVASKLRAGSHDRPRAGSKSGPRFFKEPAPNLAKQP